MTFGFRRFLMVVLLFTSVPVSAETDSTGQFTRMAEKGPLVYYSGTVTLTGTFKRLLDERSLEIWGDVVCFIPSKGSAAVIPRGNDDTRLPWFCFSNQTTAKNLLKANGTKPKSSCGLQGTATVVISDYIVNRRESEVFDTARLVKVLETSGARALGCDG